MIKINLLAEKKQGKVKAVGGPAVKMPGAVGARNLLLAVVLLVGVAIAAVWNYQLNSVENDWRRKHTAADAEMLRLEAIRKKGEQFEEHKALLARKIDLITELKKQQAVPVHILDQISWNLPDFLWLNSLSAGNNGINLAGNATTYNAVTNFYNNLNESEYFSDVTLGRTAEGDDGVTFSLSCRFVPAGVKKDETAEASGES